VHGLRSALYTINAEDARDELFGDLVPCPFQVNDAVPNANVYCHGFVHINTHPIEGAIFSVFHLHYRLLVLFMFTVFAW
jgi:hypothetical protein